RRIHNPEVSSSILDPATKAQKKFEPFFIFISDISRQCFKLAQKPQTGNNTYGTAQRLPQNNST
ncbi:hypothetical protein, partial [uncultured Muribaculum sp.]|uniref:hypothetical protein n=1 Tax=uncultured Muribaculum sp. TaxID=1918613 RepID=UPI002711F8C5